MRLRGTLVNESPIDGYDSFGIFFDNGLLVNRVVLDDTKQYDKLDEAI